MVANGDCERSREVGMRILVTGHLGYIGTVLVPMLLERGHEVHGLDTDLYRRCTFGDRSRIAKVPERIKDVRDAEAEDVEGFDVVLHLAGLSNDPLGNLDPDLTYEINHRASVRLAELAKAAGVKRFVFASSCSNYGAAGDTMLDEGAAFNPVTPYGESKVFVERDVAPLASDGFSPVFLRASTAYGVSPRLRFDLVLNNLVAWAHSTQRIYIKSDGTPWRPIVHIEDIARAYIAAAEAPTEKIHNRAFNVGRTDENFQVRDLADIVKDTMPECVVEYAPDAGPDPRCYRVSCDLIASELPYEPVWDARRGAQELIDAYRAHGVTLEEFEGETYQRVAHIRRLLEDGALDSKLRWSSANAVAGGVS